MRKGKVHDIWFPGPGAPGALALAKGE